MIDILTTPSPREARIQALLERRFKSLQRFALHDAAAAPAGIREGLSRSEWLRLPEAERLARVKAHALAHAIAEEERKAAEYKARRAARKVAKADPAVVDLPDIVSRDLTTRSFVPCSGGCGALIPSKPGRPALLVCSPAPVYFQFSRPPGSRRLKPGDTPSPSNRPRRRRRRAVCGAGRAPASQAQEA